MLAPPPPPRIKADPPADADPADPDAFDDSNPDERYAKMDIDLRESLRVVEDAINLKPEPPQWVLNAPSPAQAAAASTAATATQ